MLTTVSFRPTATQSGALLGAAKEAKINKQILMRVALAKLLHDFDQAPDKVAFGKQCAALDHQLLAPVAVRSDGTVDEMLEAQESIIQRMQEEL